MMLLLLLVLLALLIFYGILQMDIPGSWQFFLVVLEMLAVNQILIKRYKFPSEMGLVLLKSKEGISAIEEMARHRKAFDFMADLGATASYGLLSVPLMRRNVSLASAAAGMALLAFLVVLVAPIALAFLLQVANIGSSEKSVGSMANGSDIGLYLVSGIILAGGLFLLILFGLVYYGVVVFTAIIESLTGISDRLAHTAPGGALLLPGVNLPLFEGILALAIVMVVHEGAHAVLARIGKVPILSSGIVLFGIIPIGAFVEPDEKKLFRTDPERQTRVLVAGPTANLITASAFFLLFAAFFYATADFREEGLLVSSGLEKGTVIYAINGQDVDPYAMSLENFTGFNLPANSEVELETSKGTILRETDGNGKMGITFTILRKDYLFAVYTVPALGFIYVVLGLGVALNFVVGTVNILPIPLFDGYRIIDANVKNKIIVKALSYSALLFFVLNFLPLLFR